MDRQDRELVQRCLHGDQDACASLVDEYAKMVGTVIWRAIGERGPVEDLAQETFLRVFRGLRYFDGRARLSTWVYTIAHRVAIDYTRGRDIRVIGTEPQADVRADATTDPEAAAARDELGRLVRAELDALPDKYRLPLVYAAIDELDYHTIGAMLKVKPGTVKTLVFRGRHLLRERLQAVLARRGSTSRAT